KVALVVALVGLGALNHFRLVPGMQSDDGAYRLFRLNSRGEIAVAAAVLAATAILVGLAPPPGA
ncbi:MAG: CopD family protein, partial [Thermoleophilia bacterium]